MHQPQRLIREYHDTGFGRDVESRLVYFPLATDASRLAWQLTLWMPTTPDVYLTLVDAENGAVLFRHNLTNYDENPLKPHGQVFTKDSSRPNSPSISNNPPTVNREDVPFRPEAFNGTTLFPVSDPHYDWWAGQPGASLISNNTDTHLDRDANNQPDLPRLMAADGNFSFPLDLALAPTTEDYQKASQVNLFYWINRYHNILYSFGFNEAAGNFQTNNFNLGGRGADAILGDAQDGLGTNNANFSTPQDGGPGRVQMYLWTGTPMRDGSFDQHVIIHELTHGTSNRLIGNAAGLRGTQDRGMGEGWSDWFGLVLMRGENDALDGSYTLASYATGNYTRGIRRFPYSTKMEVFPLTYKDVAINFSAPHPIGEIWCNTLWEARALLIQKYGYKEGQRQSIQLVVDGMKLTPNTPSFVDARNAILLADRVNNNGANQCLLWQAFSKRGIGFRADTTDSNDVAPVESRDSAPYCSDAGTVAIGRVDYLSGETMNLSLGDRNASGAIRVQVATSKTADAETLTLMPEPNVQGSYQATLRLSGARVRAGDGVLQGSVEAGDQIVISYSDANDGSGAARQFRVTANFAREAARLEDPVEQGNQGWVGEGAWGITNIRSASPSQAWTDSPGGRYTGGGNFSLISPLLDLSGLTEVSLSFGQSYDFAAANFDFGIVESSTDDGVTWRRAASVTGTRLPFEQARVRLRGLDGQSKARVRFRAQTASALGDGWYLDDIRLLGRSANPAVIAPGEPRSPAIAAIVPAFGPPAGGTRVVITGVSFTETSDTTVTFNGVPATNVNVISGNAIAATVPPQAAGPATVAVDTRNGGVSLINGFTYHTAGGIARLPEPKSVFPNSGTLNGGTAVTIVGANFMPETVVTFGDRRATATFINGSTLRILTPFAAAPGAVDILVGNASLAARMEKAFIYILPTPPRITTLAPAGSETFFARSLINIRWESSDNRAVARHHISLQRFTGATPLPYQFVADISTTVPGEARSFAWTIPNVTPGEYRLRVVATDDEGSQTEAYTGNFILNRRWEPATPLPTPATAFGSASDGQYIYQIGGVNLVPGFPTVATVRRLDTTATQPAWAEVAPMPAGLNGQQAVHLKGKIYVPGGFNAQNQRVATHYAYDVAANTWTTGAEAPSALSAYALVADEARGVYYRIGGAAPAPATSVHAYDPAGNKWTELPPLRAARANHVAELIGGKLYVAGGTGATGPSTTAEVYDFDAKQWTTIAGPNRPRSVGTHYVTRDAAGNSLWALVGGQDLTVGGIPNTDVYDIRNNRWILLDNSFSLNTPRLLLGGARAGNFFYAYGSNSSLTAMTNERTRVDTLSPIPLDVAAPVLAAPTTLVAVPNNELRFTVTVNDQSSGAPATLTAVGLPAGASFETKTITNNAVTGLFRWTPAAADAGKTFSTAFTASDGQLSDSKIVTIRVVNAAPLAAVNSADFRGGPLAIDSIASIFGTNLAVRADAATLRPLPFDIAGTTVTINGLPAALFFVSPGQINFAVPAALEPGPATIIVSNPAGLYSAGTVQIAAAAPALFTRNAMGTGDASALATADGVAFQLPPFDVVVNGKPNILVLFATGLRRAQAVNPNDEDGVAESVTVTIDGKAARTLYAGAQGALNGLDQINVEMPASLAGGGARRVDVAVTVNSTAANRVTIQIK